MKTTIEANRSMGMLGAKKNGIDPTLIIVPITTSIIDSEGCISLVCVLIFCGEKGHLVQFDAFV